MTLLLLLVAPTSAAPLMSWDLESDDGGFLSGGETGQWEWGAVESGPGAGADGSRAWATVLSGAHRNDTVDTLTLPTWDLRGVSRPVLRFSHWYELDLSTGGDVAWVETWTGSSWTRIEPVYGYPTPGGFSGSSNGWEPVWVDLSGLDDLSLVRLVLGTDVSIALAGWYVDAFALEAGDVVPPSIEAVSGPGAAVELDASFPVTADVRDDLGVDRVRVHWSVDGGPPVYAPLSRGSDAAWTGAIPASAPGSELQWWLEASDGVNTTETARRESRVFLPAPTALEGPGERLVSRTVPLRWTEAVSAFPLVDHAVYVDDFLALETTSSEAVVPVTGRDPVFTVRSRYDTPFGVVEGDPSEPLQIDLAYPDVTSVSPAEGFQQDDMRLSLRGVDLLLAQDGTAVSLGEGVGISSVTVEDVNTATIRIQVDAYAEPGPRDLLLVTDEAVVPFEGAFTVLAGADRPRILDMTPSGAEQGTSELLRLRLSTPPDASSDALRLAAGPGVVVESVTVDGDTVLATVAVMPDAPLGPRAVTLDDGIRILAGVELRVRAPAQAASGACASTRGRSAHWAVLAGLAALIGRCRRHGGQGPADAAPV